MKHTLDPACAASLALLALGGLSGCIFHIDGKGIAWDGGHAWVDDERQIVRGSGVPARRELAVEAFDALQVEGGFDVVARVGEERALAIEGDDNLIERVEARVTAGTLRVSMARGVAARPKAGLRLVVSTPELDALVLAGSGEVDLAGAAGPQLALSIEGSGDFRASGAVERLLVSIEGSGRMELGELEAREADVEIEGSGRVTLRAAERLDVRVAGSGDVRYHGRPEVRQRVSGSGTVRAAGE